MSKSRTCLTLEKQREVIRGCDSGKSSRILAVEYGVGRTQILNIIKRRDAILKDTPGLPLSSKRKHRETGNEPVNELMFEWFNDAKRRKVHITGPMMSEQALHFAHDLGIPDFKASNGWRDMLIAADGTICDLGQVSTCTPTCFDTNMLIAADGTICDLLSAIISGSRTSVNMYTHVF